jgi:PAS domain S-box-containing protein
MSEIETDRPTDDGEIINFKIEAPYFQALNDAPVPIFIIREDGRFLLINRAVQSAIGDSARRIRTIDQWRDCTLVDAATGVHNPFSRLFETRRTLTPFRITVKTETGRPLIWELFTAPMGRTQEGWQLVICIASDITTTIDYQQHLENEKHQLEQEVSKRTQDLNATINALENEIAERKRMGDQLTLSRERLQHMSRRTLTVLEADRQTVSKELHDSIGASLAAIKFSLEEKEMKREQNDGHLDDSLDQEIAYLLATIKETKRISANLRPTTLDDLGLMATIQWYLRQYQRMYGNIDVDYSATISEADVPEPMKIIIYRIIQEGLSNAGKHSEARSVNLRMEFADDKRAISLFIEDDGRGFDVEEVLSKKDPLSGYGLTAMRERCEIFGGSFHIQSRFNEGTRVQAILPV